MNIPTFRETMVNREPWVQDALCAQVDIGDLFFPDAGTSTREAKRICRACPVQQSCLAAALARNERYGIFGGLSPKERHQLRRGAA